MERSVEKCGGKKKITGGSTRKRIIEEGGRILPIK